MAIDLHQLDDEMAAVVERVRQSLVQITNGRQGQGAGTIWHADGLVITNAHVVRNREPKVTLPDGRTLPARILAHDSDLDLAALRVDAGSLPTIELGESTRLRPGELVMSIGHPWGVEGAVTTGVVIGSGGEWPELPRSGGQQVAQGPAVAGREWVVASLHVRPGHSGGPMVDVHGRLVGINTIMAGPGVGVAVPVHVVKRFLQQALSPQGKAATPSPSVWDRTWRRARVV